MKQKNNNSNTPHLLSDAIDVIKKAPRIEFRLPLAQEKDEGFDTVDFRQGIFNLFGCRAGALMVPLILE